MTEDPCPASVEGGGAAVVTPDPWGTLASLTPARLALGRAGSALPTRHVLALAMAHALARDAVHAQFDDQALISRVADLGLETIPVESAAPSREIYLARPDLGRRLSEGSRTVLAGRRAPGTDMAIVLADGLSATALVENAAPLLNALVPRLLAVPLGLAPVVLARQARVALGDEIGALLGSRLTLMLIGERPGLSAADSLGAYLTFGPKVGRRDAERNCVSNIRPGGLEPARAAATIAWLVAQAFALSLTGVELKDDSGAGRLSSPTPALPHN